MATSVKRSEPVTARDGWFDRLARGYAGTVSRREAVGFLAGTTAAAMLGSWMRPSWAFGSTSVLEKDPGCAGARTFYKAGCSKPVPKLNYTPPVNGCGPQNGFNPVPQTPLNLATFTPACDGHDRGYGTCNRAKELTDTAFLFDMKVICVNTYPITTITSAASLVQCMRNAEIYYGAVSKFGDGPYRDGQENGCDCCEGCRPARSTPEVPCPSKCNGPTTACCVEIKYGFHHGGCCNHLQECCTGPNDDVKPTNLMSWCCPKGKCGTAGKCNLHPCIA
jgi:hypothetical protein